ncbi:MAG: CPBP family intramembrane metalloprotease, partial [Leptospira sp.]|nr:CPBP family intramembrane metalloprotease [Leptospira sp.]
SLGLTIWFGFRKTKLPFLEVFPLKAPPLLLLIPLILISTGGSILCSEIDNIFRYFVPVPQFFFEMLKDIFNPKFVVASFLAVCVLAPISEEFLLRGIILKGFLANYSKWKAILLSALLFSLMHMNPLQFVSTFLVGIFAAWLITRTNNLTLTVILHFFFNFLPWVLINFTSIRIPGFSDLSSPLDIMNSKVFQPLWLDGLGLFLLISGFFILNKLLQDTKAEPSGKM